MAFLTDTDLVLCAAQTEVLYKGTPSLQRATTNSTSIALSNAGQLTQNINTVNSVITHIITMTRSKALFSAASYFPQYCVRVKQSLHRPGKALHAPRG
jgi:hypothetical protein